MKNNKDCETIGEWSPSYLAHKIVESHKHNNNHFGKILSSASRKIHSELGCQTDLSKEMQLKLELDETIPIRFAHQANLFPYVQILAQSIFLYKTHLALQSLKNLTVPIVLIVDYDIPKTRWMRESLIINKNEKDKLEKIRVNISKSNQKKPAFLCPPPSNECIERIYNQIELFCHGHGENSKYLVHLLGLNREYKSLSDFNTAAWMNIVIHEWRLPILFIRLSDLLNSIKSQQSELANFISRGTGKDIRELFWNICEKCNKRIGIDAICCDYLSSRDRSFPRVTLDTLSDYLLYGISGGTMYKSSEKHAIESHRIAREQNFPHAPESSWRIELEERSQSSAFTLNEQHKNGRLSMLQYTFNRSKCIGFQDYISESIDKMKFKNR